MTASDSDSGVLEAPATATFPFTIAAYCFQVPLFDSVGPVVLDRSKLIGPVKTSDGPRTMGIASIWDRFGSQDQWSGPSGALLEV